VSRPISPQGKQCDQGEDKSKYVHRHFTSIARRYDLMNTVLSFGMHYLWKRRSVKQLNLKSGAVIIDVCGGTADLAILAARNVGPGGRVILYDINRAMIEGGIRKIRKASLEGKIFSVQGDAECLSFPERSFDAAMVGFGVRNLTDMEKGFSEMYRVLRHKGKLMCLEFSLPSFYWFRLLYDFYSFRVMPLAGKILVGTREAYSYLPDTIRRFPPPDKVADMLCNIGFSKVAYQRVTNGIAVIYTGEKNEAELG